MSEKKPSNVLFLMAAIAFVAAVMQPLSIWYIRNIVALVVMAVFIVLGLLARRDKC